MYSGIDMKEKASRLGKVNGDESDCERRAGGSDRWAERLGQFPQTTAEFKTYIQDQRVGWS